jgi:hypothetical protein
MVTVFYRNLADYAAWCDEHPDGFVLRAPTSAAPAMLHRAECASIAPKADGRDPTRRLKACALSSTALEQWARARDMRLARCQVCEV